MTYDEYIRNPLNTGDTNRLLPTYFSLIDDETVFTPKEVAEIVGTHEETIRRWCRQGKMKHVGLKHYKIRGIEIKRAIFPIFAERFNIEK